MTSVEVFGSLLLGTGGVNGYEGVRKRTTTKKGEKVVEYQGYTPTKHNTTAAYKTEHDAAVARAVLKENLRLGLVEDKKLRAKKSAKKRAKRELPTYLHGLQGPTASKKPNVVVSLSSENRVGNKATFR